MNENSIVGNVLIMSLKEKGITYKVAASLIDMNLSTFKKRIYGQNIDFDFLNDVCVKVLNVDIGVMYDKIEKYKKESNKGPV